MIQKLPAGRVWAATVGYSRAVRAGDLIEVAGTAAADAEGGVIGVGDMYAQTVYCLEAVRRAIVDLGGSIDRVVRTRVYLTDVSRWEEAGRAHGEMFGDIRPASAFIGVSALLHPDLLVEVEATAVVA